MDGAHLHLVLNHFPVVGAIFSFLLLAVAMISASQPARRLALAFTVLVALVAIPAYLTGEPAEEKVEHIPGTAEEAIGRHEDAAEVAFVAIEILGALALAGLILPEWLGFMPRGYLPVVLLASLVSAGLMGWTANLGGQVRRPELRGEGPGPSAPSGVAAAPRPPASTAGN